MSILFPQSLINPAKRAVNVGRAGARASNVVNRNFLTIEPSLKPQQTSLQQVFNFIKPKAVSIVEGFVSVFKSSPVDALSGAKNKEALLKDLATSIKKTNITGQPFSLAMFDMDNFKGINDLLGYQVGDEFIHIIGSTVKNIAKEYNAGAYRFGGEEFMVIFNKHNKSQAQEIATKIKDNLNSNSKLNSYKDQFIESGKVKIREYQQKQRPLMALKKALTMHHDTELFYRACGKKIAVEQTTLRRNFLYRQVVAKTAEILTKALKTASTEEDRIFLQRHLDRVKAIDISKPNHKIKTIINEKLHEYLDLEFNHSVKIAQIKKWIDSVGKIENGHSKGFTITAGVAEFKGSDKINSTEHCIEKVGSILSSGKRTQKGQVYTD